MPKGVYSRSHVSRGRKLGTKSYPRAVVAAIVAEHARTRSPKQISIATGIPRATIAKWAREEHVYITQIEGTTDGRNLREWHPSMEMVENYARKVWAKYPNVKIKVWEEKLWALDTLENDHAN